jgi:hypothetical protein
MWAQRTADLVVLIHFFWILFLVFGAFIGRRFIWLKIAHIGGIVFALIIQILGWYCPLTYIEIWMRKLQRPSQGYQGSFIIHYVEKLVYVEISGKIILIATLLLMLLSAGIYLYKPKKYQRQ